jgi:hypothetical protein
MQMQIQIQMQIQMQIQIQIHPKAGIGVAMVGAMPSVGLYFGIYSFCKRTFREWDPEANDQRQTLYIALSAAIGNTIASASRVPYEVLVRAHRTSYIVHRMKYGLYHTAFYRRISQIVLFSHVEAKSSNQSL